MNTRALTNGRDRAKGWEQNEQGNWVASAHDRRRLATTVIKDVAASQGGNLFGPQIVVILSRFSKDETDSEIVTLFQNWMETVTPPEA